MQRKLLVAGCAAALLGVGAAAPVLASSVSQEAFTTQDLWPLLATGLAWLVPAGFILIGVAGVPADRAWQAALAGAAGAGLAILAFYAVGFGLAFGGIGLVRMQDPGLAGLVWEWSALSPNWGPNWGMAGLSGWALTGPAATSGAYTLFFAQLPWVATATLIPLLALRGRAPLPGALLGGLLVGGLLYPVATNWIWGGGWLANLGINLNLGHGFVDFAAAGSAHVVGGAVALAGLLTLVARQPRVTRDESEPVPMPPVHLPLLAAVGGLLLLAGSLAWSWANPLLDLNGLMPLRGAINGVLIVAAAGLLPLAYAWFVAGRPDVLMAARGLAAGAVAAAAVGPFLPLWAALALGLALGLLLPLVTYLVVEILRIADDTAVTAVHLVAGLLGLASVGLLADGLAGAGWNGVGPESYLGVAGQGVTGWLAASGLQPDWPGQLQAQLFGIAALFLAPFLIATLVFGPLAVLAKGLRRATAAQRDPAPALAVEDSPPVILSELDPTEATAD